MSESGVVEALKEQGRETKQQLVSMRGAMTEMAKSVSDLTAVLARVEERHARHDDAMRRIGKQVDDHETRLRDLEDDVRNLQGDRRAVAGGWKVLATIGASVATITTIAIGLATYVSQTAGG